MIKALIAIEPSLRHQENERVSHPTSVYEVVGYDILLDENLKPWVCEVNTTPNMGLEINRAHDALVHEEDFAVKTRIMKAVLEITGIVPLPSSHPNYNIAMYFKINYNVYLFKLIHFIRFIHYKTKHM